MRIVASTGRGGGGGGARPGGRGAAGRAGVLHSERQLALLCGALEVGAPQLCWHGWGLVMPRSVAPRPVDRVTVGRSRRSRPTRVTPCPATTRRRCSPGGSGR